MARLFGLIGNRADLAGRVLELERDALRVPQGMFPGGPLSWGIGFYQGGDVLLRRRPNDDRTSLDVAGLAKDLRSDLIVGHVRSATTGSSRTENTHPFRYREWLFAHTGSIDSYSQIRARLLESIPEFLRKDIRGDTDSEVLFHVVLSFLHDSGRLHDGGADARTLIGALSSTASLIDHLIGEVGGLAGFPLNAILANGELVAAIHRGEPKSQNRMAYRIVHGRGDLDLLVADDALRRVRLTDPGALRFTLLASDFVEAQLPDRPSGPNAHAWTALPPRAIVVATRDADPLVEPF
jgi:predicted glutamine amidotransferase